MSRPYAHPIPMRPFSVRAILREIEAPGTGKTQTRRVIEPCGDMSGMPVYPLYINGKRAGDTNHPVFEDVTDEIGRHLFYTGATPVCPGDLLWVRETWKTHSIYAAMKPREIPETKVFYRATEAYAPSNTHWVSPIHMPRWASRITLEVTAVKIERLQAISEADAIAEGVERIDDPRGTVWRSYETCSDGTPHPHAVVPNLSPVTSYREIWKSIHGADSWEANPLVAAISFMPIHANVAMILKEAA
jgi:hypothetical protein